MGYGAGESDSLSFGIQPPDQDGNRSPVLRVLELVLVLFGVALVVLSVLLPVLMGAATGRGGRGAAFEAGYLRTLAPFVTTASMASSFIAATVILSFERSKANTVAVLFGVLTLAVFAAEISLSLYLSIVRPFTQSAQSGVFLLVGLVPLGLGCTMFTLASIMSAR